MNIQIIRDGKQTGPYTEEAVHALLKEGRALVDDLAWRPGLPEWMPLMNVLYPAASHTPLTTAPAPAELEPEPIEPATARQKAFLDYLGVAFAPEISKDDASLLVNEAMEDPRDPARLARWNEERLQLHPELFAAEIQTRKENRPHRFLEIVHEEGASLFEKVTKAHCQVLVAHLDVHAPHWDANEREASTRHFFPALAEKFPQLLSEAGKAKFKADERPPVAAKRPKSSPVAVKKRPSSGPSLGRILYAFARGIFIGLLILGLLWMGRGFLVSKPVPVKKVSPTASIPADENMAPPATPPEIKTTPASRTPGLAEATPGPAPSAPVAEPPLPTAEASPTPSLLGDMTGGAPALIPASPARTSVILTKPVEITLPFGKISVPAGTAVKIIAQNGAALTVRYLEHQVVVPASSTDLGTDAEPGRGTMMGQ